VYVQPASLHALLRLIGHLRGQHYDLAIDPSGNSTGNRVSTALAGARQRLGFAGHNQWLTLTHAAERSAKPHQAEQSLALLNSGIEGIEFGYCLQLAVYPCEAARNKARCYWTNALGNDVTGPVIGFFTQATGDKQLDEAW